MVFILMFCHLFFTFKLRFIQKYTFKGIKYSFSPKQNGAEKGIGTYAAFAAALGTTIGPGNITGVAVAISGGGPEPFSGCGCADFLQCRLNMPKAILR